MLDEQDLKAIESLLTAQIKPLENRIDGLENEVKSLKTDVSALKTDVSALKTDVKNIKADVDGLREEVHNNSILVENTALKAISAISEVYHMQDEKFKQFDFDALKIQSDTAVHIAQMTYDFVTQKSA